MALFAPLAIGAQIVLTHLGAGHSVDSWST